MRTSDLVQRLQIARRELALESALAAKLDKYHLLILDDIYVSKDQAETSVLFELIGCRFERRSMLITANQPFDGSFLRFVSAPSRARSGPLSITDLHIAPSLGALHQTMAASSRGLAPMDFSPSATNS